MSHSTGSSGHSTSSGGRHITRGTHVTDSISINPHSADPTYKSIVQEVGPVTFPSFQGERIYMAPISKRDGVVELPTMFARWRPAIEQMLKDIPAHPRMYLMVDEANVKAGQAQRRPGPHIDGNWVENLDAGHGLALYPETLLLASSEAGCIAYQGAWTGFIGQGGDVSHVDLRKLEQIRLKPGVCYAGNVTMIHESIPVVRDCQRTLVRINVPYHQL